MFRSVLRIDRNAERIRVAGTDTRSVIFRSLLIAETDGRGPRIINVIIPMASARVG